MTRNPPSLTEAAAIAAHRFGLGEPSLAGLGGDPAGWLAAQIGPADAALGASLPNAVDGLRAHAAFAAARRQQRAGAAPAVMATGMAPDGMPDLRNESAFGDHFRPLVQADLRARLGTAVATSRPFAERLALFWANHFTVSMAKAGVRGLVGAFEREAIRPHIAGAFPVMLKAAVTHPAMLRYLDNVNSAGPGSAVVRRLARQPRAEDAPGPRIGGLNENLARELLELHTLGANRAGSAGYTQADVTEVARILTGWRVPLAAVAAGEADGSRFDPRWHEPGAKTVLGRVYGEGPQALDDLLADIARHPSTADFLATKLARHFAGDEPPPALVARLAASYQRSGGELAPVYRTLIEAPEAWAAPPAKLKTPEEFVISSARLLGLGSEAFARQPDAGIGTLGQRVQAAPSPAGWSDRAEDWLGPDAVWKRIEWATRVAARLGRRIDARELARASLGVRLAAGTAREIDRAADGPQALALLLLAPEFQRR